VVLVAVAVVAAVTSPATQIILDGLAAVVVAAQAEERVPGAVAGYSLVDIMDKMLR
jgi:hypothetical protein